MDKEKGESFSKVRFSKVRAAGDEKDTEGHSRSRARGGEGESFSKARYSKVRAAGDEKDTEGHSRSRARGAEGESFSKVRYSKVRAAGDDDVEGHRMPSPRSPSSRGE